ncbi:MucB/RseB C-terminal domain-containing protein [Thalassotalea ponticola]|uniref:MucB/RseB C-terminal domain-containing protein n=1 Tax=Thalassotalea ponticola TaxID=1523392 RepID=UPI0025B38484|nr:MucB/RseB C-terminal domain-containing protein [Thalassotalea ponticola]MDN3652114.1 MucB/RseB C-terminal domain-containing protein [Thalassotalea ponticola]
MKFFYSVLLAFVASNTVQATPPQYVYDSEALSSSAESENNAVASQQTATDERLNASHKFTAQQWMTRLDKAMQSLNFDTSFVVVRNNRAEPYRWLHGVKDQQQIEFLTVLNGARHEAIRYNQVVSYFEPDRTPYSVASDTINGPIPATLYSDYTKLEQNYHFILVGKSRILGRQAQLIRLESKDKNRFGYWLWLDAETGLMLKVAVVSKNAEILEQIQFTHLQLKDDASELFEQVKAIDLPELVHDQGVDVSLPWSVTYLPKGFEPVSSQIRYVAKIGQRMQTMLFNDGLVDISVYVAPSNEQPRAATVNQTGATTLLSLLKDGHEITVIGKIPAKTAAHIAESVVFN